MLRIAVLVSGSGTNLAALIEAEKNGRFQDAKIELVLSSKPNVYALTRAEENNIKTEVLERKLFSSPKDYDQRLAETLKSYGIDFIVLAGFMVIIGEKVIETFENRIINIHPSLIPSFCGEGYYGLRVHRAALAYGVKLTGATVHFVNNEVDGGKIIMQKAVEVLDDDTPETLQKRVMEEAEWEILSKSVELICKNKQFFDFTNTHCNTVK